MKKIVMVGLFLLSLFALQGAADAQSPWKIGHVRAEGSAIDQDVRRLTETIAKETGGPVGREGHGPHMLNVVGWTGINQQGERHLEQVIGCPSAPLHGYFPHMDRLFSQSLVLYQVEFGHQFQ